MVDNLFPADAVAGAPSYSGRMLRQAQGAFLAGATSARPLGARSGVRPGTPSTTVTATSAEWTCQPFGGVADVMTAGESGPYSFAFGAVDTGAVTAAHATLPRVDIVYVAVEDPAEGIGTVPLVERRYLAGTAAASPVAPSIPVGERGFVIAEFNVPISGGGTPTVTWVAPYTAGAGGVVPFNTQAQLLAWNPGTSSVRQVRASVFADPASWKNGDYIWTGSAWIAANAEGYALGSALPSGGTSWDGVSPLQFKRGTTAVVTDGSSILIASWPGGSFPNGLLDLQLTPGDAGASAKQAINAASTVSQLRVQMLSGTGVSTAGTAQRVNFNAIGW